MSRNKTDKKVALVVPHIFLHRDILPDVIFSPGVLAIKLAEGLEHCGIDVTLFTPGSIDSTVKNISADMSYFEAELNARGDSYLDLLKKHPSVFVSLARQVQSEIIAKAYDIANKDGFDLVHIYTNEEDIALPFSKLCRKPVIFTHHDPFNFLIRYRSIFPKYPDLNYVSFSISQRKSMPQNTNWIANIYHGLDEKGFEYFDKADGDYVAFLGRIIEPKGVHLAIEAVNKYNLVNNTNLKLKIAGKHYSDTSKDDYWQKIIQPKLSPNIEYVGFIKETKDKNEFLGRAKALIVPSTFDEPFGMVMIEALASGTPLIGLNSGSIPEIINQNNGILVVKDANEEITIERLSFAITQAGLINRKACREDFEKRFTISRMCRNYADTYEKLISESS